MSPELQVLSWDLLTEAFVTFTRWFTIEGYNSAWAVLSIPSLRLVTSRDWSRIGRRWGDGVPA